MDEPTNDLDIETLELLEDLLLDYSGTLLLVSHDRAFLNNLVTSTLVLDGSGEVREYVGGYDDWQRQQAGEEVEKEKIASEKSAQKLTARPVGSSDGSPRKLSYKEQRALESQKQELANLPHRIEAIESELASLNQAMAGPAFYQQDSAEIAQAAARLKELEDELATAYQRWEELEQILNR